MNGLLENSEFADYTEPYCPVVLALDVSGTMNGQPIADLNAGLKIFVQIFKADQLAAHRTELAVVTFGVSLTIIDFVAADVLDPLHLTACGGPAMGAAVQQALNLLRERKDACKRNGLDYYRPWIFMISDGVRTDGCEAAVDRSWLADAYKHTSVRAFRVQDADLQTLARFSAARSPLKLKHLATGDLFQWLSKSLAAVDQS